ncbi:MAG: flippase [bacterium]|nr:flippase [bacterium]
MLAWTKSYSFRKVSGNLVAQLVGKFVTTLATLVVTIFVARSYGPATYGYLTIILTFPALFYIIADFGLNTIFIRDAAKIGKINEVFSVLLGLRVIWSLTLVILAALILFLLPYPHFVKIGILIGLVTIITQSLYTSANAVFQSRLRYDRSVVASSLGSVTILILVFIAIKSLLGIWVIPASYVLGGVVMVLVSSFFVRQLIGAFSLRFDKNMARALVVSSLPLGLAAVFSVIEGKVDHLLLSILKPAASLGYYGVAYKIFEVVLVLPTFFMNAAYPLLVKYLATSQKDFARARRISLLTLMAGGFVTAFVGYLSAPALIRIVGGRDFGPSVGALRLLFVGLPFFFVTAFLFYEVILYRQQLSLAVIYFLGAVFNIVMNLIFIPRYDFNAAAIITGATEALILVLLLLALRGKHSYDWQTDN